MTAIARPPASIKRSWRLFGIVGTALGLLALAPVVPREGRVEDQVVRLHVSKREVERNAPWQVGDVSQQSYLGVVLPGGRVLTTALAVENAAFLEVQRFGSSQLAEAEVAFVDYEVNLAVVKPVAANALAGTQPVVLGDDLGIDDAVDIFRMRDAYQLSRMGATLTEVGLFGAVTSTYSLVSYLLKVQQAGLGWAEPVFRQGKLVALTTGQDANFVHAVPSSIIRHFLGDKLGPGYRGFPSIGVQLSSLTSPELRRMLHADKVDSGIRVGEVLLGGSFSDKLKADDVILAVDDQPVSEHGFYTHARWGKVHLKYLLNQHYAGDPLRLKILRQGQELTLEAPLERYDSNRTPIVTYREDATQPHLIFGGLLFEELSQEYLKQWGKEWREAAPLDLLYTLEFGNKPAADPATRIVFLARVLADDFNRGYGDTRNQIVDTVNGVPVTSLAALRAALQQPLLVNGRAFARIRFQLGGGEVILAYDGLNEAHKRIAKTYEIPSGESFYRQ